MFMRNLKAIGLLVLAVFAGLAAAIYAAGWVSQRANLAVSKVVVAAVDIEMGTKVTPHMLTTVDWPQASKPEGAFADVKEVQDRVLKVGLLRGDALLDRKLAPPGTQGGLSAVIAEGKRAMTVRVNDVVGVAGFALPGNYVDVMIHAQQERTKGENTPISVTVLEQVLVLAVAQEASRDDTKPKVVSAVTLEVTPAQAEKLDLARSVGQLSLVLRNQLDKLPVNTAGITKDDLLKFKPAEVAKIVGGPPAPQTVRYVQRPAVIKEAGPCVEVIRSGTRANECF
jgi:pilus assembly protein CpaB